jgi:hypothetical protein
MEIAGRMPALPVPLDCASLARNGLHGEYVTLSVR